MANKCNLCGKFLASVDGAKCSRCSNMFHRVCANISPKGLMPPKWLCRECKGKNKSPINITDPTEQQESEETYVDASTITEGSQILVEIKLLRNEIVTVSREMASFRQEFARLNTTINEFNNRINKVEDRLTALESRMAECPNTSGVSHHENVIMQLRHELDEREQENLSNDIIIQGLEEKPSENIIQIVNLIATKIGVSLDDRDVVFADRVGPRRAFNEGEERPRPRPIVARLTRRAVRDQLLRAARVRRGADSTGIIEGKARRFYINERLTRTNAQLFLKAREEGRRKSWRFVWTNGGRIFVRKDVNSTSHRIRSENDFGKFFGAD